jgi:DNA-binding GntR family transcriptional regulator
MPPDFLELSTIDREARDSSLGDRVRRQLERMILDGTLAPGTQLNEVALATRLGVSRGPIREAARALERAGLVNVIRNRGAFVRIVPLDEALESYILNGLLFAFGAAQLSQGIRAEQALHLRRLLDDMEAAATAGDGSRYFALNVEFHECIVGYAGNRQIEAIYLDQTRKLQLSRRRAFDRSASMAESNTEHRAILDAILAGEPTLARERAEAHSRAGRGRFLKSIEHQAASS